LRLTNLILALLVVALSLHLFLAALLPTLLALLTVLLLLLALLFPTLLPLLAVLLLLLAALFPALLLFHWLLLLRCLALLPASVSFLLTLLLALLARGLVFLPPLFASAPASLGVREITRTQKCARHRQRQSNPLKVVHVLSFLSVLTSGERSTVTSTWQVLFHAEFSPKVRMCVGLENDLDAGIDDMG